MEYISGGDPLFALVIEADPPAVRPGARDKPVVLLHPTPLDHRFWTGVLPSLSSYRVIVPDLRGHGRSPLGAAPVRDQSDAPVLTIEQLARDVIALLDALAMKQAIFAGCSIGGYTLFELWRTAPKRIAGLVFCASKPQADTEAERAKRSDWITKHETARLKGEQTPTPEFVETMLTALLSVETRQDNPAVVAEVRSMMLGVKPEAIQAIQRGLGARPDSRTTAQSITVPTCVIAGEQDSSSRPEDMAELQALIAKGGVPAEYHVVAQAAHYIAMEAPSAMGSILAKVCQSVSKLQEA